MINIGNIEHTDAKYILTICDKSGAVKAKIAMPDDAVQSKQLMKEDYIQFSFTYNTSVSFLRGDHVDYEGTKYYLRSNYIPEEIDSSQFKYTLKFESEVMLLQDAQFYYTRQQVREASWSLTSDASSFIQVVVDNANRYFGVSGWKVGTIEPKERKYISFNNSNVFDALTNIAQQFDAEWYVTDKTINLVKKFTFGSQIEFESEVNINGISRSEGENPKQYTRILALGSTRNLPASYRQTDNGSTIEAVYQKRLRMPVAKGDVIDIKPNLSPNEVVETTIIFDDVYPKRVGKITEVTAKENIDKDDNTGVSTKWNSYRFKDSGLTFKSSYLLKDKDAELRIVFQSGKLNGLDFAVRFDPDNKGDNSTEAQVFEILRNENYGKSLPNDVLKPAVNDEYIMYGFDIQIVSNTYIPAAEQALYDKAMEWLRNNAKDKSVYTCPTIINAFAAKEMDLDVGQEVKLVKGQGGGRNLLLNTGFQNAFASWNPNGGTRSIVDDILYGKTAKIVATGSGNGIYQACTNRVAGSTYTMSAYIKADKAMKVALNHEGGTGSKTFNVTTTWQRYEVSGVWNAGGSVCFYAGEAGIFYLANLKYEKGNPATDWSLAPEDVEGGIRSSRIMGFEKKLYNKYDVKYTVGENAAYSRLANIEKSIGEIKYADQVFENTGNGSNIYLIKQFDNTTPTDFNAYSAKASDAKYFNKQTGGNVQGDTIFERNMQVYGNAMADTFGNDTFTSGQFGSGFRIWKNKSDGQSYAEFDNIMVRREMQLNRLTVAEIKSVSGQILVSPANMICSKVVDGGTYYQCFFDTDGGKIANTFSVDDQAICRRFNGKNMKYYWRRVTLVGTDYINLSKTDVDGTGIPEVGDELILFGNRTNVSRQSAIIISSYGADAPSIKQYAGVNSYNLTGKEVTVISPAGNKFSGTFEIKSSTKTQSLEDYTNEKLDSIQIGGRNLLIQSNIKVGYYADHTTGNIISTDDYAVTDFIDVGLIGNFAISNKDKKTFRNVRIAYYDNNKSCISGQIWSSLAFVDKIISMPYNGRYIRFSANSTLIANFNEVIKEYWKIELGNKVTDWTPAPEDVQAAIDMAQSIADTAKTNAVTANSLLADIANDNKLTATEKQDTKKEWDIIVGEYSKNILQANTFGISTTNYTNAYNTLSGYLASLLSSLSSTSDINGGTFRTNFKNYYDACTDLLNAIAVKSKQLAENAQNTADNIQIGGRNLVSNSKDTFTLKKIEGTATNENVAYTGHFADLIANETYTFQCKTDGIWGASNDTVEAFAMKDKSAISGDYVSFNTNPKTFVAPKTGRFYIRVDANNRQYTHSFWEFKIEKGNKATDWSPAPEDIYASIDNIQIGGRNLSRNFRNWTTLNTSVAFNDDNSIKLSLVNTTTNGAFSSPSIAHSGDFIVAITVKTTGKTTVYIDSRGTVLKSTHDQYRDGLYFNLPTNFNERIVIYATSSTAINNNWYIGVTGTSESKSAEFSLPQLITGNKLMDWIPALEDMQKDIDNAVNLAQAMTYGKILYKDPTFTDGNNKISVYNNSNNGMVVHTRIPKVSDAPTSSGYCLEIRTKGPGTTPNLGGFNWGTPSRANAKFVTRLIAKIPKDLFLNFHSNAFGTGSTYKWLTSTEGTGLWAEYILQVNCGNTGTFQTTNFFSISGTFTPTEANPLIWYLAYATVIDITSTEIDYDTAISVVQSTADTAKSNAATANSILADIANDNKLTATEKQNVKKEWDIIVSEYTKNKSQAGVFGVTTTSYDTQYNTLNSYITPLLANLATTSDIVGATFRTNFKNYYDARTDLLNAIATKAKQIADSVQDYSARKVRYIRDWLNGSTVNTGNHWVQIKALDSAGNNIALNKTATFYKSDKTSFVNNRITNNDINTTTYTSGSTGLEYVIVDLGSVYNIEKVQVWHYYLDGRKYYQSKTEASVDGTNWFTLFDSAVEAVYKESAEGSTYYVKQYNAQTNAINSANQTSQYLREAFTNDTTVTGGVIGTSLFKVGATNSAGTWVEKAGINGAGSGTSTVRFYSGGTLAQAGNLVNQAVSNKASFAVTEGGKLYSEDAVISGIINATSGKIGGFTINGNILKNTAADTSLQFNSLSGASYLSINESTSTLLAMRADTARTAISIQTYATGARGLSIIANVGSTYAIESYGPHRFGQRYSESWNAPGVLFSALVKNSSTLYNQWGNGMIITSFTKTSTGTFDVKHNLGHTQYTVLATSYWDTSTNYHSNAYVRVEYIDINSFRLRVVNSDNGGLVDTNFTFVVFGRNVW